MLTSADACSKLSPVPTSWGPTSHCRPRLQAHSLSLSDNALRGPAFPAAWLRPGAFAGLAKLSVGGNNQITGLLPDQLPWPAIVEL